jgi:hypothetical protein
MSMVVVTAQVNDVAEWEERFRTHGDLFLKQTISRVDLGSIDEDYVACVFHADDLDAFFEVLGSPESAEAMEGDGVDRESVKVFVIDRRFDP